MVAIADLERIGEVVQKRSESSDDSFADEVTGGVIRGDRCASG